MSAPKGNQFWKQRATQGREKLFETPELLWEAACEYFQWCDDNPLTEEQGYAYQGIVTKEKFDKMRAYTLMGLCLFLDCDESYFRSFKSQDRQNKEEFITVIKKIENTIYNQKFTGAAANLLNPNIIARDLGLKDQTETQNTVIIPELSPEQKKKFKDEFDSKY